MSFVYSQYALPLILISLIFIFVVFKQYKSFGDWVLTHWFFKISKAYKTSILFYVLGIVLLLFSLLDLRGPEKFVQSSVSNQKTMILIDTSASMFVEDVRPNRFEKAILLVKHYVKKAVGQKISVAVFSDGQKTIVPFTDDIDLVEARVESLKNLNLRNGGTSLSLAVQQAVQNFKFSDGDASGNILIFTDAEETDGGVDLKIPGNISIGVVGIGTRKGGPIPIRNSRGVFMGNKKHEGKLVVSKLDEGLIEDFGEDIEYFKYWIATSYTLPTEEILSFFSRTHQLKLSQNNYRIRPVEAYKILIPSMVLFLLAYLFRTIRPFVLSLILIIPLNSFGQMNQFPLNPPEEPEEPVKSKTTLKLEDLFAQGKLNDKGKKYLANKLFEDKFYEDSSALFDEVLENKITNDNLKYQFNRAASEIKNKKVDDGIQRYRSILKHLENNPNFPDRKKLAAKSKLNILKALKSGGGGGKGENDDENKDQQEKDSKSDDKNDGEGKQKKKNEDGNSDDQEKKPKKDMKRNDGDSKKETPEKKQARKKKLPALLKQLMSDDNKLQKKMIDAETTKRKSSQQKDW